MTRRRAHRMLAAASLAVLCVLFAAAQKRRATPVNTPATQTQPLNAFAGDTARANALARSRLKAVTDTRGNTILIDTLTGEPWTDTLAPARPDTRMVYPLLQSVTVGADIWDAVMRATGQDWGLGAVWASVSLHNRYMPVAEIGLGQCAHDSERPSYRYRTGTAPFFKIGLDYNFLYNSSPDYRLLAGVRYGLSPFSYEVTDAVASNTYWGDDLHLSVPSQRVTAQYFEVLLGVRVRLWRGLSAGWSIKFHKILSEGSPRYGKPWYIPGYGSRGPSFAASFSLAWTVDLGKKTLPALPAGADTTALPADSTNLPPRAL